MSKSSKPTPTDTKRVEAPRSPIPTTQIMPATTYLSTEAPATTGQPASAPMKILSPSTPTIPNIIVFGETGTGKSSLINMLAGREVASTSSGAVGETFSSKSHDVTIAKLSYRLWDTAGMNEGVQGTIPAEKALENLRNLVLGLQDGVNLLLYCIRAGRYRDILRVNYDMFHGIICQSKVPIVLVVTGCENESPEMDSWWVANGEEFKGYGLLFANHACVTTTKGKQMKDGSYMFEEEYEASEKAVQQLIHQNCPAIAWSLTSQQWIEQIGWRMRAYMDQFNQRSGNERKALDDGYQRPREFQPPSPDRQTSWSLNPFKRNREVHSDSRGSSGYSSVTHVDAQPSSYAEPQQAQGGLPKVFNAMAEAFGSNYRLTEARPTSPHGTNGGDLVARGPERRQSHESHRQRGYY